VSAGNSPETGDAFIIQSISFQTEFVQNSEKLTGLFAAVFRDVSVFLLHIRRAKPGKRDFETFSEYTAVKYSEGRNVSAHAVNALGEQMCKSIYPEPGHQVGLVV
jgi:hypothetical protein